MTKDHTQREAKQLAKMAGLEEFLYATLIYTSIGLYAMVYGIYGTFFYSVVEKTVYNGCWKREISGDTCTGRRLPDYPRKEKQRKLK